MLARRSTRSAGAIPWRVPGENQRTVGGESAAAAAAISQQQLSASSQQPSAVGCRLRVGCRRPLVFVRQVPCQPLSPLTCRLEPRQEPSGLQPNSQALDEAPSTSRLAPFPALFTAMAVMLRQHGSREIDLLISLFAFHFNNVKYLLPALIHSVAYRHGFQRSDEPAIPLTKPRQWPRPPTARR